MLIPAHCTDVSSRLEGTVGGSLAAQNEASIALSPNREDALSHSFFIRKTIDELRRSQNGADGEPALHRALGPFSLMALGVGAIIGAGIFVLTGAAAARYAGPAVVLSFALAGLRLRHRRPVLCGARLAHSGFGQHLQLRLCDAR